METRAIRIRAKRALGQRVMFSLKKVFQEFEILISMVTLVFHTSGEVKREDRDREKERKERERQKIQCILNLVQ